MARILHKGHDNGLPTPLVSAHLRLFRIPCPVARLWTQFGSWGVINSVFMGGLPTFADCSRKQKLKAKIPLDGKHVLEMSQLVTGSGG